MATGANQPFSDQDLANIPKPSVDPVFRDNFTQIFDAAVRSIESQNADGSQTDLLDSLSQIRSDIPLLLGVLSILDAVQDVPEVGAQALISIALATVGIDAVGLTNGFLEVVRDIEELTRQQIAAGGCVPLPIIEREGTRLGQILTQFGETINSGGLFEIAAKLANSFPEIAGVEGANVSEVASVIEALIESPLAGELQRPAPTGVLSGFTEQEQEEIVGSITNDNIIDSLDAAVLASLTYLIDVDADDDRVRTRLNAESLAEDISYEIVDIDGLEALGLDPAEFSDTESGFSATLFRSVETGEYVLGFRGTDEARDFVDNVIQGLGAFTPQYILAELLANEVNMAVQGNLSFVGHSLGGGLASAAALATGRPAQTFNAAGLSQGEQNRIERRFGEHSPTVTAYYVEGEILSAFQDNSPAPNAFGNRIALEAPELRLPPAENNPLDRSLALHGIGNVITALE